MRTFFSIVTFAILISCNYSDTQITKDGQTEAPAKDTTKGIIKNTTAVSSDTTMMSKSTLTNLAVLILPPYDLIANEGVVGSPFLVPFKSRIFPCFKQSYWA
jgi:hypothetical protein